jgi:hypothetical protein
VWRFTSSIIYSSCTTELQIKYCRDFQGRKLAFMYMESKIKFGVWCHRVRMVWRINQPQPVSVGSRYDHQGLAGESLAQSD